MTTHDPSRGSKALQRPRRGATVFRVIVVLALLAVVPVGMVYFPSFYRPKSVPGKSTPSVGLPPLAVATMPSQFIPEAEWEPGYREQIKAIIAGAEGKYQIKFHGVQRGVPRADDWVTITSTGAGFSVAMPRHAADLRMIPTGENVALDSISYNDGELRLAAVCGHQADGLPLGAMEDFLTGFRRSARPDEIREIQWKGRTIYEGRTNTRFGIVRVRCFANRDGLWTWRAECAANDEARLAGEIDRFLDSFQLPLSHQE